MILFMAVKLNVAFQVDLIAFSADMSKTFVT